MIILAGLFLIGVMYWAFWLLKVQRMDRMTASLISPPSVPFLGNGLVFIGSTEKILKNLQAIAQLSYENKGAVKLWLGPKLYVAISNAEDAQVVLENCLDKDGVYRFLKPWLGQGLFIAPVGLWKAHRKVLLPVFHNKVVEQYIGVIVEQSKILCEKLAQCIGKGEFDVFPYISACTLDIMFETAMGEKMDVQHTPNTPYLIARHIVMSIINLRLFKVWLQPDCVFNLTPYAKQQQDNIHLTHKFTDEVVKKRRQQFEQNKQNLPTGNTKSSNGKPKAVLDLLFDREIAFTDEQLREHIDSITIAGNDTTALVIAYTIALLGNHQDIQEKVYNELQSIFGDSKREATKEDLIHMSYLERVIKESMRFYSVVPIIARNIDKDIYLPHSGITLPAGCGAVVGTFAVHRSKTAWGPDVDEFDPDRFLPERSINRHPAAFQPFSYGSRNCIGRNFGMIIMKTIISNVIREYKIEADDLGPLKVEMLLFPIGGHQIKVSKR